MDAGGQNVLCVNCPGRSSLRQWPIYLARLRDPHVHRCLPWMLRCFEALPMQSSHLLRLYARNCRCATRFRGLALRSQGSSGPIAEIFRRKHR